MGDAADDMFDAALQEQAARDALKSLDLRPAMYAKARVMSLMTTVTT